MGSHHKPRRPRDRFGGVWQLARCEVCGKFSYGSRGNAKRAIRNLHPSDISKMAAYRCPEGLGFHIGHLSDQVKAGSIGREVYE